MPLRDPIKRAAYAREYGQRPSTMEYRREWARTHRNVMNDAARKWKVRLKERVLSHYGRGGIVACCWDGCSITDVDMLTIDHIKDDGAEQRRKLARNSNRKNGNQFAGKDTYAWLVRNGFPEGFQTLCCNHQMKKEIMRRERLRLQREKGRENGRP